MSEKTVPVYKVSFRNLSSKVSESKFIQHITKFGDVEDVKFRKDRAYAVRSRSKRAAEKASLEMDGKKFEGQTLSVSFEDRRQVVSSSYAGGTSQNKKEARARSRSHSAEREGVKRVMKRRPTPRRSFSRSTSRG